MRSSLFLVLFSVMVLVAIAMANDQEDQESLSSNLAESRVARSAEAEAGERKMKKIKKKGMKKGRKNKTKKARKNKKKQGRRKNADPERKKKGRKNKTSRRRRPSSTSGRSTGRSTASATCFESAIFYMKIWKDVVGNFEKQRKRMVKQNKTGGNKSGKKGLFAPIAHRLVDIGGGNKSNMSCGGQYGNKGAAQLQNLTKTLFDCEKDVNASCNPATFPQPNFTFINHCKELVDNFTKDATVCLGKSVGGGKTNTSDACSCWTGQMLNMTAATLKDCKASKESSAITAALKKCTTAFGKCRKFEDAASTAIMSCASDSSKLTKKAANLAANNASMTAAKEKMASLASSRFRQVRSPGSSAASCAEVITISETITKMVEQNPQSTKITIMAKKISTATVTCSTAEKASMAAQVTAMESAIVSVNVVLVAIQEQIETLTGSTATSTQLDAAATEASTATAAPSGRRNRILKHMMNQQL